MEPLADLAKYAQTDEQLAWLAEQLAAHPIPPGLSPDNWLLWRTRVAEGMQEVAALQSVLHDSIHGHLSAPATQQAQPVQPAQQSRFPTNYQMFEGAIHHPNTSSPMLMPGSVQQQPQQTQQQQPQHHQQQQHQQHQHQQHLQINGNLLSPFMSMGPSSASPVASSPRLSPAPSAAWSQAGTTSHPTLGPFAPVTSPVASTSSTQLASTTSPAAGWNPAAGYPGYPGSAQHAQVPSNQSQIPSTHTKSPTNTPPIPAPVVNATAQGPIQSSSQPPITSSIASSSHSASPISSSPRPLSAAPVAPLATAASSSWPSSTYATLPPSVPTPAQPAPSLLPPDNPFHDLGTPGVRQRGMSSFRVVPAPRSKWLSTRLPRKTDDGKGTFGNSSSFTIPSLTDEDQRILKEIQFQLSQRQLLMNQPDLIFKYLRPREDGSTLLTLNPENLSYIFQALDTSASSSYLAIMAEKRKNVECVVALLRRFTKRPLYWSPAIAPMVQMLARMRMSEDFVKEYRMGKKLSLLMTAMEDAGLTVSSGLRKMSDKFLQLAIPTAPQKKRKSNSDSEEDIKDEKKRRVVAPPPPSKPARPTNPSTSASASDKPVSKTGTRTDMSFFNTGIKTKTALPSFKKRPPPPTPAPVAASSSAGSLLQNTMKMLKQNAAKSEVVVPKSSVVPKPGAPKPVANKAAGPKLNKKGHTVKWLDDPAITVKPREFLAVREFRQEPHELEPAPWQPQTDEFGAAHPLGAEFSLIRAHVREEIPWYEPDRYVEEQDTKATPEAEAQEARERAILTAPYTPDVTQDAEDNSTVRVVRRDQDTRMMNTNPVYLQDHQASAPAPVNTGAPATTEAAKDLVTSLLNKLDLPRPAATEPPYGAPPSQQGSDYHGRHHPYARPYGDTSGGFNDQSNTNYGNNYPANNTGSGYNARPGSGPGGYQARPGFTPGYNANNNQWNNNRPVNHNRSTGPNRWQKNRGRGGGQGRPTCRYWLAGNCPDGDRCKFPHSTYRG